MIFIYLQTSKIQLFNIQIMKNFEVWFWQEFFFCFDFGRIVLVPACRLCWLAQITSWMVVPRHLSSQVYSQISLNFARSTKRAVLIWEKKVYPTIYTTSLTITLKSTVYAWNTVLMIFLVFLGIILTWFKCSRT